MVRPAQARLVTVPAPPTPTRSTGEKLNEPAGSRAALLGSVLEAIPMRLAPAADPTRRDSWFHTGVSVLVKVLRSATDGRHRIAGAWRLEPMVARCGPPRAIGDDIDRP